MPGAQNSSHIIALRPKYMLYSYMDPLDWDPPVPLQSA